MKGAFATKSPPIDSTSRVAVKVDADLIGKPVCSDREERGRIVVRLEPFAGIKPKAVVQGFVNERVEMIDLKMAYLGVNKVATWFGRSSVVR